MQRIDHEHFKGTKDWCWGRCSRDIFLNRQANSGFRSTSASLYRIRVHLLSDFCKRSRRSFLGTIVAYPYIMLGDDDRVAIVDPIRFVLSSSRKAHP